MIILAASLTCPTWGPLRMRPRLTVRDMRDKSALWYAQQEHAACAQHSMYICQH